MLTYLLTWITEAHSRESYDETDEVEASTLHHSRHDNDCASLRHTCAHEDVAGGCLFDVTEAVSPLLPVRPLLNYPAIITLRLESHHHVSNAKRQNQCISLKL